MKSSSSQTGEKQSQQGATATRRPAPPGSASAYPEVAALQDTAGNAAVSALLQAAGGGALIQRQCTACREGGKPCAACQRKEEEQRIRRKETGASAAPTAAIPSSVQSAVAASGGTPLAPALRAGLEQQFNRSFSQVRVHTDGHAARAADDIDAAAFTIGQSIWFGRGRFRPETREGMHLLSHELAHTVQQGPRAGVQRQALTLGATNDPLETAADRAADAVLSGHPISLGATSQTMIRRAPKVSRVKDRPNERYVDMPDGTRYRVVRNVKLVPHSRPYPSGGQPTLSGKVDKNNVWLQVDWCKDGTRDTRGQVKVGVDLPAQAQSVLQDLGDAIKNGTDPAEAIKKLKDAELTPFASVDIAQSERFKVTAEAKATVQPGEPDVKGGSLTAKLKLPNLEVGLEGKITAPPAGSNRSGPDWQVGGTLTIPLDKPKKVTCPTKVRTIIIPQISYDCFQETPEHTETRQRPVTRTHVSYLYFKYAEKTFETNAQAPGGRRNPEEMAQLETLLQDGYQVTGIRGFASPEGPQQAKNRFIGNVALSQERAQAAYDWIAAKCRPSLLQMRETKPMNCFAGDLKPTGQGELYTQTEPGNGAPREVEGRPLAEHAVEEFGAQPAEERHRTPETEEALQKRKGSPERQAKDIVYPLLRRAEISLSKQEQESYEVTVPAKSEKMDKCPPGVIDAAEADFDKSPLKPEAGKR